MNPITAIDVAVLVNVVDPKPCSSGRPQSGLADSESPHESLERVKLIWIDYAKGEVVASRHCVNLSRCVGDGLTKQGLFTNTRATGTVLTQLQLLQKTRLNWLHRTNAKLPRMSEYSCGRI